MACTSCSSIPGVVTAYASAGESFSPEVAKQAAQFKDVGYHGDDLDAYYLLKCLSCGTISCGMNRTILSPGARWPRPLNGLIEARRGTR